MATEKYVEALPFLRGLRGGGPLTFGRMLRALRLCDGASLATYAARLGVAKPHLSDIEHGRRAVSVERAAAWAQTLGYHAGQFVELALQAQLRAAGLPYVVSVRDQAPRRTVARRAAVRRAG